MFRRLTTLTIVLSFSFAGSWAEQNPFVGTWELVPSKSTFNDVGRRSHVFTLEDYGSGLRSHGEIVYGDGRKMNFQWSATFDGTASALQGDSHYDSVEIKRIDERSLEITSKKGSTTGRTSRWVISPDGKTMTKVQEVMNAVGELVDNLIVFEKQNPFVGTWKLLPSKSTFNDMGRRSHIFTLEAFGNGLRSHGEVVYGDGRKVNTEWSATFDGRASTLTGDTHFDSVAIKRIDERSLLITSKKGSSAGRTSRWVISPDGKTMTKVQEVMNAVGELVDNLIVLEKQ